MIALRGIHAGLGTRIGRAAGGFTVHRPEHRAFDGADRGYGDVPRAAFKAMALYGDITQATLDAGARGNGVIVSWKRGEEEVFTAATCEWVMGLARGDRQTQGITRHVLDRFGGA